MPSRVGTEYRPVGLDGFWFGLHRLYLRKSLSSPGGTSQSRLGRSRLVAGYQLSRWEWNGQLTSSFPASPFSKAWRMRE